MEVVAIYSCGGKTELSAFYSSLQCQVTFLLIINIENVLIFYMLNNFVKAMIHFYQDSLMKP